MNKRDDFSLLRCGLPINWINTNGDKKVDAELFLTVRVLQGRDSANYFGYPGNLPISVGYMPKYDSINIARCATSEFPYSGCIAP